MAKTPTLTTIATGYYSTTALNNNFDEIETAFENTLSLDGSTPNAMEADFDLNGYNILNAGNVYTSSGNLATLFNITVSALSPSGGNDGDLWFVI